MIKVFKLSSMVHTPFENPRCVQFLADHGVVMTDKLRDSDALVSRFSWEFLRRWPFLLGKKLLVWTHEPRYNTDTHPVRKGLGPLPDIHIMNIYTGDVMVDNHYYTFSLDKALPLFDDKNFPHIPSRKIAAIMCYQDPGDTRLMRGGQDIDLNRLRVEIALAGYRAGRVDIYGPGWPRDVKVKGRFRDGDWVTRKLETLKDYRFHLCFENTNVDHYCTEKIWHSIAGGCLPIYYGRGNRIYEDFPRDSFLDYAEFSGPQELFNCVDAMSAQEFRRRMNLCVGVYNDLLRRDACRVSFEKILMNIVQKLRKIVDKA